MSLDEIPAELLHLVCSNCTKPDIASLRLTSRFVSAVADEHLLPHVTVFFLREEFDMVEEIVKNPRIAKGVRDIRFQADRLSTRFSHEHWLRFRRRTVRNKFLEPHRSKDEDQPRAGESERQRRRRQRETVKRWASVQLSPKDAEERYMQLYWDQVQLMEEDRAHLCMQRLFMACPRLENVTVAMQQGITESLLTPAPWHCVRAFNEVGITAWRDDSSSRIAFRPLSETLTAASRSERKLKSLSVEPISFQFFAQDEDTMAQIHSAITELEKMHISINDDFKRDLDEGELEDRMQELEDAGLPVEQILEMVEESEDEAAERGLKALMDGRIASFVQQAPRLREITLEGPFVMPYDRMVDLKNLVGLETPWQDVKILRLLHFSCEWKQLVSLILRYRRSLEFLAIGTAHVQNAGDWARVWSAIDGQLPKLRAVRIEEGIPGLGEMTTWRARVSGLSDLEKYLVRNRPRRT